MAVPLAPGQEGRLEPTEASAAGCKVETAAPPPASGSTPVAWASLTPRAVPKLHVTLCGSEPICSVCHPPPQSLVRRQEGPVRTLVRCGNQPGRCGHRAAEHSALACVLPPSL